MRVSSHGREVPKDLLGELSDSTGKLGNIPELCEDLEEHGYLLLRGLLDRNAILKAREDIFQRLADVGEIRTDRPVIDGIATGESRRDEVPDKGAFWKSVSETPSLRRVTHQGNLHAFFERFLGCEVVPFDFLWLRTMPVGYASGFHFDHVYMNRGTEHVYTCWIPLGDVPKHEGPLLVIENGHRFGDLVEKYRGMDVDRDPGANGTVTLDPVGLAQERRTRLLTTDFKAGDCMILTMFCLHGSLDNNSPENRVRLSCDVRYQPAEEPRDERWFGEDPVGHGKGYAPLSSAQPMTAPPVFR